ncbi:MAG: cation acetate symporter [Pseudomonadota bacterium]
MGADPIVIIGTILYFAVVIYIGFYTRKAALNASDYYVAGRRVGPFINGSALAATYFSPATFLGMPAFIFLMAYPFWWALTGIIAGMPVAALLTAAPLRKYAPTSFTDYYADRYDTKWMRLMAAIPTVICGFAYVALSIVGTALCMVAILKINYIWAVLIAAGAVFIYIYWGGMVATTFSTAFQGVLMTVSVVIAALVIVWHFGGFNGLTDAIVTNNPIFFNVAYSYPKTANPIMGMWTGMVGFYFIWHFGFAAMPYTVVRFFTSQDIKSARRSVTWAVFMGGIMYMGLVVIGSAAKVMLETMHPLLGTEGIKSAVSILVYMQKNYAIGAASITDYSMFAIIESLKMPWLMAIIIAGGLAISMATAAGWVMVLNITMGRDMIGKVFGSKWPEEKPVTVTRLMTTIVMVVCTVLAFNPPALVLDISGAAFLIILCSVGPPMIMGIWWDKSTTAASYITIVVMTICSGGAWLYANSVLKSAHWFFLSDPAHKISTPHQYYWIPIGFIFFIIVSLMTKPPRKEVIQKYCYDIQPEFPK